MTSLKRSMPSWDLFDSQPAEYRNMMLPTRVRARISLEAGTTLGWDKYIGLDGKAIGIDRFGASVPAGIVYEKLGLIAQKVVDETMKLVDGGS